MDLIQKSRSNRQKEISCWCLVVCVFVSIIVLLPNFLEKKHIKSLLTSITDSQLFPVVIFACALYILFGALCFSSLIVYWEESKQNKWPVLSSRIVEYLDFKTGCSLCFVFVALYLSKENVDTCSDLWDIILPLILLSAFALFFAACNNLVCEYDDVDLSIAQRSETSIGALWAVGAYVSFYKLTLEDIIRKIGAFEAKNKIQIPVKKLFIICPLSCNVNGSFNDKDNKIFDKGQLEPLEIDQGANLNRRYKHSVYGVKRSYDESTYVVAEFASPLGTLWEKRNSMNEEKFRYHRDCVIKNFKDLLRNYPCIVLEYDDQNSPNAEPLHRFLLSSIQKQSQDSNVTMQEEKNFL